MYDLPVLTKSISNAVIESEMNGKEVDKGGILSNDCYPDEFVLINQVHYMKDTSKHQSFKVID